MNLFEINKGEQLFPYYKPLAALFVDSQSSMDLALMNWGWQRPWDESKRLFNARKCSAKGQSIWQSKVWGEAIRQRRCLLPIDCFYEWDQNFPRGKRPRYRIEPGQREVMSLGAIYEINHVGEFCLSVCTTEPNDSMQQIHHRMPVMIEPEQAQEWLFSEDQHAIDHLMQPRGLGALLGGLGAILERHAKIIQKSTSKIPSRARQTSPTWHQNRTKKQPQFFFFCFFL